MSRARRVRIFVELGMTARRMKSNLGIVACHFVIAGGVLLACCAAAVVTSRTSTDANDVSSALSAALEQAVRKQVEERVTRNFEPSLEMRENVDFLLTPALLVQNAISSDLAVTYPSE